MKNAALLVVFLIAATVTAGGTYQDTTLIPPSLGFETTVRIYLPEGYDPGGTEEYPAIYWLHGWLGSFTSSSSITMIVLDDLISSQQIPPVIVVKPDAFCMPYGGSNWANSILYGNYEDYVTEDLVDFIESSFHVISDPEYRCIAGHSMGGSGSMKIALSHTDLYRAVASHAGFHDHMVALPYFVPNVLEESPETSPPYTYDWGNGSYTDALIMTSGANSPNLQAPDSIDFILDTNGDLIDSVYALWELRNPAHMVKSVPLPIDLAIFFDCGTEDAWEGVYECNCSYSDTLSDLSIDHEFQSLVGVGHNMNVARFTEDFLFLCGAMTGIEESEPYARGPYLAFPHPNPFRTSTELSFTLSGSEEASIEVFDVSGRLVEVLYRGELQSGHHSIVLDPHGWTPGVYFVRLTTSSGAMTRRCLLIDQ
jgi:S-formylglutathione hydrolase FrmB